MRSYSYFPGCSSSEGGAKAYGTSTLAVSRALDMELIEVEDWNCCGSTPYSSIDELSSLCLSARNLSIAEKKGLELVTPCSSCYVILNRTNGYLKEYPRLKAEVAEALAAGGLTYHGKVRVRHLLDVFVNDIGYDTIKARVKKELGGLKVVCYYGCLLARPPKVTQFDICEYPESMDRVLRALGIATLDWSYKTDCCGASFALTRTDIVLRLSHDILEGARSAGADAIVVACPLCQINLDIRQDEIERTYATRYRLPILYFTQLMGISFGLSPRELLLGKHFVNAEKKLEEVSRHA